MLFEHAEDPARELCRIERHGLRVVVHHHRTGEVGRIEQLDRDDLDAACAEYDRQIVEVYARGYRIVRDWVDPPLAHDPELEAMIAEDPDDETRWMVLADWVLSRGDVRTQIIRFAQTRRTRDPAETYGQFPAELFGDASAAALLTDRLANGEWVAGYVRNCRITCDPGLVAAFIAAPSTRLVRGLQIASTDDTGLLATLRALNTAPCRRTVRRLTLLLDHPVGIDALAPIFTRELAPALTRLDLLMHREQDVDPVFSALVGSPLLPQLRILDPGRFAPHAMRLPALAPLLQK